MKVNLFIILFLSLGTALATAGEKLHPTDRTFLESAAMCGIFEQKMAELASQQGSAGQVRDLGRKMSQDQMTAGDALKEFAKLNEIDLPPVLNPGLKNIADGVAKLQGADFDKRFLLYMGDYQDAYLRIFTDEAERGHDADIKKFASDMATAIQADCDLILKLQTDLKITAAP